VSRGAVPYLEADRSLNMLAIKGIGGSLLYFVQYDGISDPFAAEFERVSKNRPEGVGVYYLDHLTHYVFKGNMDRSVQFYQTLFNFRGFFLKLMASLPA
jgi:4-hydroxyphenylpyruvate dioxygenase